MATKLNKVTATITNWLATVSPATASSEMVLTINTSTVLVRAWSADSTKIGNASLSSAGRGGDAMWVGYLRAAQIRIEASMKLSSAA